MQSLSRCVTTPHALSRGTKRRGVHLCQRLRYSRVMRTDKQTVASFLTKDFGMLDYLRQSDCIHLSSIPLLQIISVIEKGEKKRRKTTRTETSLSKRRRKVWKKELTKKNPNQLSPCLKCREKGYSRRIQHKKKEEKDPFCGDIVPSPTISQELSDQYRLVPSHSQLLVRHQRDANQHSFKSRVCKGSTQFMRVIRSRKLMNIGIHFQRPDRATLIPISFLIIQTQDEKKDILGL